MPAMLMTRIWRKKLRVVSTGILFIPSVMNTPISHVLFTTAYWDSSLIEGMCARKIRHWTLRRKTHILFRRNWNKNLPSTENSEDDKLLRNIDNYPHAYRLLLSKLAQVIKLLVRVPDVPGSNPRPDRFITENFLDSLQSL
jgi:hypothetical protein